MFFKRWANQFFLFLFLGFLLAGCQTMGQPPKSDLAMRSMQTRTFHNQTQKSMMQAVISTLQDLSFVIDQPPVDATMGVITAIKWDGSKMRVSIYVKSLNEGKGVSVRVTAFYGTYLVDDAQEYQQFFNALSRNISFNKFEE